MAPMFNDVEQEFLTPAEVAKILNRHPQWVRDQCRINAIPHHKIGGRYVFTRDDVDAYLTATHRPAVNG